MIGLAMMNWALMVLGVVGLPMPMVGWDANVWNMMVWAMICWAMVGWAVIVS